MIHPRQTAGRGHVYLAMTLGLILLICLILSACLITAPRPPRLDLAPVPLDAGAAQALQHRLETLQASPPGPFTLSLTQSEATSWLAFMIPDSPFVDPQVWFRPGHGIVAGTVTQGVPLRVVAIWRPRIDDDRIHVVLESMSIGPLAIPTLLLGSVTSTINEILDDPTTGIALTELRLDDGVLTISGVRSP